jgi:hypothetical protein
VKSLNSLGAVLSKNQALGCDGIAADQVDHRSGRTPKRAFKEESEEMCDIARLNRTKRELYH